jgi:Arc/MetJ-type ribon-helix-helix transcriptional regulator
MRTRQTFTVSLPPEMARQVERLRRREHRTRSELVREALRTYFARRLPVVETSHAERRTLLRGRAEFTRGEFRSLNQVLYALGRRPRPLRRKTA